MPREATKKPAYIDREFNLEAAKVLPGGYVVTACDLLIVTVLGSCVSVCLRDRVSGIGGMNHFMLPERNGERGLDLGDSARYGAYAMEVLINDLLKLGAQRERLEAKVFGAGRVLSGVTDIGERNARFALAYLQRERISIAAQDLGGVHPRKIYFFPANGRVFVRLLRNLVEATAARESAYVRRLAKLRIGGDVDLFQ